ncbi:MAG: T9SS type A sorting domain-containing protein [Bacteroidota bacterium]
MRISQPTPGFPAFHYRFEMLLAASLFVSSAVFAQWSSNSAVNTPITAATAAQYQHSVMSDGSGGSIIAWTDGRASGNDIYAQKVNSAGVVQWTADGVAICSATNSQDGESLTSDGSGGAIIVWQDFRSSNNDIYAQRINSAGTVQWNPDGVAISTLANSQTSPKIVSDGSGGAIMVWFSAGDIYAQRINSSGVVQWTANGVVICDDASTQSSPQLVPDGAGGAIISWIDGRTNGTTGLDIYAQRINSSGSVQWTANGVVVCNATGNQTPQSMISDDSSGALIAWQDLRTDGGDIYCQRMFPNGSAHWTANGKAICTSSNVQSAPVLTADGNKGAIISWQDLRGGLTYDIYAQSVNSNGTTQWSTNGEVVCSASDDQTVPSVVADGNGGALISWQDHRSGTTNDVYTQLINGGGTVEWTGDGVATGTATGNQNTPQVLTDAANGVIVVWLDYRSGSFPDIYASRLQFDGTPLAVELAYFNVLSTNLGTQLQWTTSTEVNNYGFEVERRSIGSQLWTTLSFVAGSGTSNVAHDYSYVDAHLPGGRYAYRIKQIDQDGRFTYSRAVEVTVGIVPKQLILEQNYPNPFNPSTTIEFSVPEDGRATLRVYDITGREVASLFDGDMKAGYYHHVLFDASRFSSGLYFSRLEFHGRSITNDMTLVK